MVDREFRDVSVKCSICKQRVWPGEQCLCRTVDLVEQKWAMNFLTDESWDRYINEKFTKDMITDQDCLSYLDHLKDNEGLPKEFYDIGIKVIERLMTAQVILPEDENES